MKTISQRYFIGGGGMPRKIEAALNELGAKFKVRSIFSEFHGVEVTVEKFQGKGSQKLNEKLIDILYK